MDFTTLLASTASREPDGRVIDVGSLWRRLATVPDRRHAKGLRYPLGTLLLLVVLAKLAGQDHPSAVADWISARGDQLRAALQLAWPRMPQHNTYRRIFAEVVTPEELDRTVSAHLQSLPGVGHSLLVTMDGKTVRGTIDAMNPHGDHFLTAYLTEEGIVLLQMAVDRKENEISVAPALLKCLDLRGKVVAGDALHTQRQLSVQIVEAGGDYLWIVKENQPTLRADIAQVFTGDDRTVLGGHVANDFQTSRTVEKGHGRRETRAITVSSVLNGYSDWPGMAQVFRLERQRVHTMSGQETSETVYGVTSLTNAKASPERLLSLVRAYWGIENGLHYRRDVTFHEDRTRLTQGKAGQVMGSLNNLVIGLLRHAGATNLAAARRWYDANLTLALSPLTASPIT